MAICCQEPADAWILPQMQGETGLQDVPVKERFLAVIKLLYLVKCSHGFALQQCSPITFSLVKIPLSATQLLVGICVQPPLSFLYSLFLS